MGKRTTTTVEETHDSSYQQRGAARTHHVTVDEPHEMGGKDTGPDPYELLLMSLGACTSMTIRMYANLKKIPLEHVRVDLSHERIHAEDCAECLSAEGMVDQITRCIALVGPLSDEQRERLLEIANRCPVHRTLTSENRVISRLQPVAHSATA